MDYDQKGILAARADPTNANNRPFNENVDYAIKYFRAFMYPIKKTSALTLQAPPIAVLNFPGMALNEDGSDHLFTVMTQCDVSYEKGFSATGYTRSAKLSLAFTQVIQGVNGQMNFKSIGEGGNYMRLDNANPFNRKPTRVLGTTKNFETKSALSSPNKINRDLKP